MHVYVPYIQYGRTHKHSLKRARQTHRKIRNKKAEPADSSKKGIAVQVWADLVSCLKRGPSNMSEYSEELRLLLVLTSDPIVSMSPNRCTTYSGCPAPREIIADTGAAVDLIGARE